MNKLENDFAVRKATLKALGGDPTGLSNIYEVDLKILEIVEQGGGGLSPEEVREIIEEYGYTTMEEVEAKQYMQQKKLSLNGDDPLQILDEDGNVLTYNDVKALVDNKALFVYMLVDNAFYIPCGDMVVPSGKNAVEFSSAFIVDGGANMARIIINTDNEVLYEQYWLADKEWVRGQGYLTSVKTINGESIVGEGNVDIKVDLPADFDGFYVLGMSDSNSIALNLKDTLNVWTASKDLFLTSTDGKNWTPYVLGTSISVGRGQKLYWRGDLGFTCLPVRFYPWTTFSMSGKFNIGGNIASLLKYDYKNYNSTSEYCFKYLFLNCTSIIDASELILPALKPANYAYYYMFLGCTSMVKAPKVMAKDVNASNCMGFMFSGCTSLLSTPVLGKIIASSADSLNYAFLGCTSLEKVIIDTNFSWGVGTSWLSNVPAYGTFCDLGHANIQVGPNGVPEGWAVTYSLPNDVDDQNATPGTTYSSAKIDATFVKTLPLTQAEYDELPEKDVNTLYIITDAE